MTDNFDREHFNLDGDGDGDDDDDTCGYTLAPLFIAATKTDGFAVLLNIEDILAFEETQLGTKVACKTGANYIIHENMDTIKSALKRMGY